MDLKLSSIYIFCTLVLFQVTASGKSHISNTSRNEKRVINAKECLGWLEKAGYRSNEQLLQLFLLGVSTGFAQKNTNIVMERGEILKMSKKIETIFPLKELEEIRIRDSLLTIRFKKEQSVVVPGTFRQARLNMSREVHMIIGLLNKGKGIEFLLTKGYINLDCSWLARLFSKMPDKMEGDRLKYWCFSSEKKSVIGLCQETWYQGEYLEFYKEEEIFKVFPGSRYRKELDTIALAPNNISIFGQDYKWRGEDSLYADGKWRKSKAGVQNLEKLYKYFFSMADTLSERPPEALILNDEIMYNLEDKRCSLRKSFRLK